MLALTEAFDAIRAFMERGGDVLYLILVVTFVMWVLMIERMWYFTLEFRKQRNRVIDAWEARNERQSWFAHKIRTAMISEVNHNLFQGCEPDQDARSPLPSCGPTGYSYRHDRSVRRDGITG